MAKADVWKKRWTIRPRKDAAGMPLPDRFYILRNGIQIGYVQPAWGGGVEWVVWTWPRARGRGQDVAAALSAARDVVQLREIRQPRHEWREGDWWGE